MSKTIGEQDPVTSMDNNDLFVIETAGGLMKKITKGNSNVGNTFASVVKKVDETVVNNATLQDDDELFVALEANKTYFFMVMVFIGGGTSPGGIRRSFNIPTGSTGFLNTQNWANSTINNSDPMTNVIGGFTSPFGEGSLALYGRIIMGGTAGDLQYVWAQLNSDPISITIRQGSSLTVWEEI